MNRDRVKGMIDEVAGSAKRKAGKLTGNTQLKVEGMVQQAKGKAEGAWGKAKDAVRDAIEDTEVHLDAHVKLGLRNSAADAECNSGK
jgi:uncharacterized protein YjbJ (UPF0337 family)